MQVLQQEYLGNTLQQWMIALTVTLATFAVFQILKLVVVKRLRTLAESTETDFDDFIVSLLASTKLILIMAMSLYAGSFLLELDEQLRWLLRTVAIVVFLLQATFWGNRAIDFGLRRFTASRLEAQDPASVTFVSLVGTVARIAFVTLVALVALGTVGFNVTPLITGVGIGGIAIAMAVNGILQDLFGSLSIALDKPFVVGDFITVGEFQGTVEHVGLKSTRVRSNTGEQLVMSNSDLLSSRVRNFGRMQERRGNVTLGVTYDTPADKLAAIPSMVREIVNDEQLARFDRAHFASFGDSSLNFAVVYWVTTPVYLDFMDATQSINLKIVRRFEQEGIEMAFPTRTVHVHDAKA